MLLHCFHLWLGSLLVAPSLHDILFFSPFIIFHFQFPTSFHDFTSCPSLLSCHPLLPTTVCLTTNRLITHPFSIQSHQLYSIHSSHLPSQSTHPSPSVCQYFISVVFLFRHCYSSIPLSPLPLIIHLSSVITCLFILHYSVALHPLSVPPYLKQPVL